MGVLSVLNNNVINGNIKKIYFSLHEVATMFNVDEIQVWFYDETINNGTKVDKEGNRRLTVDEMERVGYSLSLSKYCNLYAIRLIIDGQIKFEIKQDKMRFAQSQMMDEYYEDLHNRETEYEQRINDVVKHEGYSYDEAKSIIDQQDDARINDIINEL